VSRSEWLLFLHLIGAFAAVGEPGGLVRPATALTLLLIAAYLVALWAMAAKPA
jgi:hypothetical protein